MTNPLTRNNFTPLLMGWPWLTIQVTKILQIQSYHSYFKEMNSKCIAFSSLKLLRGMYGRVSVSFVYVLCFLRSEHIRALLQLCPYSYTWSTKLPSLQAQTCKSIITVEVKRNFIYRVFQSQVVKLKIWSRDLKTRRKISYRAMSAKASPKDFYS